jgi:hypothetical protein
MLCKGFAREATTVSVLDGHWIVRAVHCSIHMPESSDLGLIDRSRVQFNATTTEVEFCRLAGDPRLEVLQCGAPVPESMWVFLNAHFFSLRQDVELRVYGHYSGECDLRFARHMTNVRRFSADCLRSAQNVGFIAELQQLKSLAVGIFDLRDYGFLNQVSPTLKTLELGPTRSSAPSLAPIGRFGSLQKLYIEGHIKDIEVVSRLRLLEDLTLRSVTTPDLSYIAPLANLRSLDIKLGGIRSFAGAEGKASIKYLELWQVRDLRDIEIVSTLLGLQNLFLQSLPHIRVFPSVSDASVLRRVIIESLKGLRDFRSLENAPALEEFALIDGRAQTPEQLLPVLRNANVRAASASFGSSRKNLVFAQMREQYGKLDCSGVWQSRFDYR